MGRPQTVTYTEDISYQVDYAYNNQGALDTVTYPTSTAGYRLKLQYAYTNGQLSQVRDFNNASTQFWTLTATNAANQALDERMANSVRIISGYDSTSGAINYRQSGNAGSTSNLQNISYQWDKAGNLTQRKDELQNLTEAFNYDDLYRLGSSTLKVGTAAATTNFSATYNAIGNVVTKSDVGASSFDYTTKQAGCTYYAYSQPHAARKVGSNVYCYDANGNMTSRAGSTISWTSYNLPSQINSGSNYSQFSYGANRQRWKQVANYSGTTETTIYVGGLIEKVTRGAVTEYKHYIAGGSATAIYTRRSDNTTSTYYVSSDHLGSSDVITDGSGAAIVRESFAAFGARRGSNWSGSPSAADQTQFTATTRHGYTGHEMLDNLSLIHMNGRVYDPQLGRFISADPYIQSPMDQQSLNRYSYVSNGPMSATDPSGYFKLKDLLDPSSHKNPLRWTSPGMMLFQGIDHVMLKNPSAQPWAAGIACVASFWSCWGVSAHLTRINGGSDKDIAKSAVIAAATWWIGQKVGDYLGGSGPGGADVPAGGGGSMPPAVNVPGAAGAASTGINVGGSALQDIVVIGKTSFVLHGATTVGAGAFVALSGQYSQSPNWNKERTVDVTADNNGQWTKEGSISQPGAGARALRPGLDPTTYGNFEITIPPDLLNPDWLSMNMGDFTSLMGHELKHLDQYFSGTFGYASEVQAYKWQIEWNKTNSVSNSLRSSTSRMYQRAMKQCLLSFPTSPGQCN